ncbi:MAG TPA: RNA methyltransferase substrate-binding domain-containing protein, partial [Bacteroidota bacterium]|nr:RNA methyltransferase substrate-binding domain-containing protein [Bacteroidota bacterium]
MHRIIAGRKPVLEALRAGTTIEKVVFLLGVQGKVMVDIKSLAEQHGVQVIEAGKQQFRELANDVTTQGVVAVVPTKEYVDLDDILTIARERNEQAFILILDEVEDPHNLGALVRT